jgi:hypothetical protein
MDEPVDPVRGEDAANGSDDLRRQQLLLELARALIHRGDLRVIVRRPSGKPWSLRISARVSGWRRLWRRPTEIVYCGGSEEVYFFVTELGGVIAPVDHMEAAAERLAEGPLSARPARRPRTSDR